MTEMMFVCYSLVLSILWAAYHSPDLCLLIVLALAARLALR
ncbi:MAG: hypothetical protein U0871_19620 [Gemmataceae bacterium]